MQSGEFLFFLLFVLEEWEWGKGKDKAAGKTKSTQEDFQMRITDVEEDNMGHREDMWYNMACWEEDKDL